MQQIRVNRKVVFFTGVLLNSALWGGWFWVTHDAITTLYNVSDGNPIVKINVLGLWMPFGFLGALVMVLVAPIVALVTGIKASVAWGSKGDKIANYLAGGFALLGIVTAICAYQWMTGRLEERGYSYCKTLTKISAMGRHEVYVAKPELCVKPNKIP